ncbi:MAG: hypothetical protein HYR88_15220 [Verrucomicrobia bacterium]|nr:hypothetical protein [Verrucomicrobiota bacterium]MBI3868909.1 hypothetical protein [Verrucomicrobiota bacterium]
MKPIVIFLITLLVPQLAIEAADPPIGVISPPELKGRDGNSQAYPGSFSVHFQQRYAAADFSNLPPGGALLREIAFRADQNAGGHFSGFLSGVQITVSTLSDSALSPIFANNKGSDAFTFIRQEETSFVASGWNDPFQLPHFGLAFGPAAPAVGGYLYDPSKGDLFIDVTGLDITFALDSYTTSQTTSVWQDPLHPFASTGLLKSEALPTLFAFVVPEPSPVALIAIGIALLCKISYTQRKEFNVTL